MVGSAFCVQPGNVILVFTPLTRDISVAAIAWVSVELSVGVLMIFTDL